LNFSLFVAIHTAAIEMLSGKDAGRISRKPEIMADAAYAIFCRDAKTFTGNFAVDDKILEEEGITNLDQYAVDPGKGISYNIVCGTY
jgi:hypothetical protein